MPEILNDSYYAGWSEGDFAVIKQNEWFFRYKELSCYKDMVLPVQNIKDGEFIGLGVIHPVTGRMCFVSHENFIKVEGIAWEDVV